MESNSAAPPDGMSACISYLLSLTPSLNSSLAKVHCQTSLSKNASDSGGLQGGQLWSPPTLTPSMSPSLHPTLHGRVFVLRGEVYYDANANGMRDAGIESEEFQTGDVEYKVGLGGVSLRLVKCTDRGYEPRDEYGEEYGESDLSEQTTNSFAQAVSLGYDVMMHPQLVSQKKEGGKYNLINIKVNRAYFIQAEAPAGFLFTGGICNDDVLGWECPRTGTSAEEWVEGSSAADAMEENNSGSAAAAKESAAYSAATNFTMLEENALGIRTGRSVRCVSVDRSGLPDGTLDFGVTRVGDVSRVRTQALFAVDLNDEEEESNVDRKDDSNTLAGLGRQRSLLSYIYSRVISSSTSIMTKLSTIATSSLRKTEIHGHDRVLIDDNDRNSIGVITAEILATTLDEQLAEFDVVIDHVAPKQVVLTMPRSHDKSKGSLRSSDNNAPERMSRLSVDLEVWGHYPPNLEVDFDYIVQDSIDRTNSIIRDELMKYNVNCKSQTAKVQEQGFKMEDFQEILSNKGKSTNGRKSRVEQEGKQGGVFRTACSNDITLPDYVETKLNKANVTQAMAEPVVITETTPWWIIALVALMGVMSLAVGFLIFRKGFKKPSPNDNGFNVNEQSGRVLMEPSERKKGRLHDQGRTKFGIFKHKSVPVHVTSTSDQPGIFRTEMRNIALAMKSERNLMMSRINRENSQRVPHVTDPPVTIGQKRPRRLSSSSEKSDHSFNISFKDQDARMSSMDQDALQHCPRSKQPHHQFSQPETFDSSTINISSYVSQESMIKFDDFDVSAISRDSKASNSSELHGSTNTHNVRSNNTREEMMSRSNSAKETASKSTYSSNLSIPVAKRTASYGRFKYMS